VPELIEVELYRRLAERTVGRRVEEVHAPDPWFLKRGTDAARLRHEVVGCTVGGVRRRGKLLLVDLRDGPVLGLRFGMTGRLLVDDEAVIERLEYASGRHLPSFVRWSARFADGGTVAISDPRRLGGVELDPDEGRLGPDAASLRPAGLRAALAGSAAPLKARLLDQARIAGLGNLLVDEALWRAGLDPGREAGSLSPVELRRLHRHVRATVEELLSRGGSHTGDLHHARARGATCPRDGAPLQRRTIGGRTTYSCPAHQR
jgi:formamidopyrimidine-DNA glycosylase